MKDDDKVYTNIDVIIILSTKISYSDMTTDSSYSFIKKKGNVEKPVHIIIYPENRYWPIGNSLTELLKFVLPEIYDD
jgi:hypothetical protein